MTIGWRIGTQLITSIDVMRQLACSVFASIPLFLAAGSPCLANDSSAELSVGGLVFTRSDEVSLESETLRISPDVVAVRYQFLNQTQKPVTLTIAFPLPDIDLSEGENYSIPNNDPTNFLGFKTKVDGKPVNFSIHQRAFLGTKDISAALRGLGVPLLPIGPEQSRLSDLPEATREQLIQQGLLLQNGTDDQGRQLYEGAWTVKTSAVRQQTFEPNRPAIVEHRYHTSLGMSFDTVLRKGLRQNKAMATEIERYRKDYCVNDAFLAMLDKLAGGGRSQYSEASGTAHQLRFENRRQLGRSDQGLQADSGQAKGRPVDQLLRRPNQDDFTDVARGNGERLHARQGSENPYRGTVLERPRVKIRLQSSCHLHPRHGTPAGPRRLPGELAGGVCHMSRSTGC